MENIMTTVPRQTRHEESCILLDSGAYSCENNTVRYEYYQYYDIVLYRSTPISKLEYRLAS